MVGFNHSATVVNPLVGRSGPKEPGHGPDDSAHVWGETVGPVVVQDSMIVICVPAVATVEVGNDLIVQGDSLCRPEAAAAIVTITGPTI